jgi:hypothetical protein
VPIVYLPDDPTFFSPLFFAPVGEFAPTIGIYEGFSQDWYSVIEGVITWAIV